MINKHHAMHFRRHVIHPTLVAIGLYTDAAEELLLGTAIQESHLVFRRQHNNGPARGLFQMEPATHDDIWTNYLRYHHALASHVKALLSSSKADKIKELEHNDKYACAMARVQYKRAPTALPAAGDVSSLAQYWKKYYNTAYGAGSPSEFIRNWHKIMG